MTDEQKASGGSVERGVGRRRLTGRLRGDRPSLPRRDASRVIIGAAEVLLFARDPHLAARAAWLLLKDQEPTFDENAGPEHAPRS
jgi:hypothetical protein